MSYRDYLPKDPSTWTEDDLWEAIAEDLGVEPEDIADGDLVDYL